MKKILIFLLLIFVLSSLFSAVVPVSKKIGIIATEIKKDSAEELILRAVNEEFTEEWVEKYASCEDEEMFIVSYTTILSSLPLKNVIISNLNKNEINALSLSDGIYLTFLIKDGKIEGVLKK